MSNIKIHITDYRGEWLCDALLPEEVIDALKAGDIKIEPVYIGWHPQSGVLSTSDTPNEVMNEDPSRSWACAGFYNITLTKDVRSQSGDGFLLYMTREQRKERGYI